MFLKAFVGVEEPQTELMLHQLKLAPEPQYSGSPPYYRPVYKTTSLLRPCSFKPNVKTIESFYYFEDSVDATTSLLRPGFHGPTVVALTGFHCNFYYETARFKFQFILYHLYTNRPA